MIPRRDLRVQCIGVGKTFVNAQGATVALRDCDLEVERGSFVSVIGPSGCGKSTLLRIIGGLETASEGSVHTGPADEQYERPAFVFQEQGVFPWLTVQANVEFGLRMQGVSRAERRAIADDWIGRVGLTEFRDTYPARLSGGMRQRVSIARAFATGSDLLLMDEPLGALDAQTRALMQEELLTLWKGSGTTVVLVTHSIEEAILLGDRVVVMTRRPGTVKVAHEVPLPRPRSHSLESDPVFGQLKLQLWDDLRSEVEAALNEGSGG